MKSTIMLAPCAKLTIEPSAGSVKLGLHGIVDTVAVVTLTPDQVGALLFAIEQAAEAVEIAEQRLAA